MSSSVMAERRLKRKRMVENKVRLLDFYLSTGRDLLQEILEVYTSPGFLYESLIQSDYYSGLSQTDRETYLSMKNQNSFLDLELDQTSDLLKLFTRVAQPRCLWCGNCPIRSGKRENIGENLEVFMSIWNVVNKSNLMADEEYSECVSALRSIAETLSKMFAFGKPFLECVERDLEDTRPVDIQLVSRGKDVSVQIGHNNTCTLNVEVFDHLTNNTGSGSSYDAADDLVKMILHMDTASTSGFSVAHIEERILRSLSGEQLQRINKVLEDKFGVKIVVTRKGCVVLVLRKTRPFLHRLQDKDVLGQFLLQLLKLIGFSDEDLSVINFRVDITEGDEKDEILFSEYPNREKGAKGLELLLHPRKTIESLTEKNKGELVSTILSAVQDQDPWEMDGEIQIQAHFTVEQTNGTKGVRGYKQMVPIGYTVEHPAESPPFKIPLQDKMTENSLYTRKPQQNHNKTLNRGKAAHGMDSKERGHKMNEFVWNPCVIALIFLIITGFTVFIYLTLRSPEVQEIKTCDGNKSSQFMSGNKFTGEILVIRNLSHDFNELTIQRQRGKMFFTSLDISCNKLAVMNFSRLLEFQYLRHLNISNNRIERAEGLDVHMSLLEMDVSNNRLSHITDLQSVPSFIRKLDLRHNQISSLNSNDFSNFPYLEFLDISHNPIRKIDFSPTLPSCRIPIQDRYCRIEFSPTTVIVDCSDIDYEVTSPQIYRTMPLPYTSQTRRTLTPYVF